MHANFAVDEPFVRARSEISLRFFFLHTHRKLSGCTLFITGASRGIGKAIALKAARDGANVVIAAKTADTHPKLPGTIYTAAEESKKPFIHACPSRA